MPGQLGFQQAVCVYTPEHGDRVSQLCSNLQVKFQAGGHGIRFRT